MRTAHVEAWFGWDLSVAGKMALKNQTMLWQHCKRLAPWAQCSGQPDKGHGHSSMVHQSWGWAWHPLLRHAEQCWWHTKTMLMVHWGSGLKKGKVIFGSAYTRWKVATCKVTVGNQYAGWLKADPEMCRQHTIRNHLDARHKRHKDGGLMVGQFRWFK